MENTTIQSIMNRRSHRSYEPTQLTDAQLQALKDAMLQAPSALNRQPWHFSIVQDQELMARINRAAHKVAATMKDGRSPRFDDPNFHVFYHAPTVVIVSSPRTEASLLDSGIAAQTIVLAAESMGLGSVMVALGGYAFNSDEKAELEKALHFPEGYAYTIAVCLGTPNDTKEAHPTDPAKVSFIG